MPGSPSVTGVSPREGPPFTKLTIRGENLGDCFDDIESVKICGVDCKITMEWHSPSKITVRTLAKLVKGQGDIVIKTKQGGIGSSMVTFTALEAPAVGPLDYSNIWVEDSIWQRERTFKPNKAGQGVKRFQHGVDGNDITDPLGIGKSNSELVTNKPLGSIYPGKSSDMTAENFEPTMMIAESYHQATFEQLKSGLEHMKKKKMRQKKSRTPVANVKDSLPVFFEVYDTLQKIHDDQKGQSNYDMTQNLSHCINMAHVQSEQIFDTVLSSKERADKIREALKVMNQFRSLFSLPQLIDANRKLGNYEQIIQDYSRVRQLFKDTNVKVFKSILETVDGKIGEIEQDLRDKLLTQSPGEGKLSLKTQEHYLVNLVQLIALRISWQESEEESNGDAGISESTPSSTINQSDSLFEPCWQLFQNRCDRLAVELSGLKSKLDQTAAKGKSTRFCESAIETTAISIVELKKLLNLCKNGKINQNILVKETYLKSASSQMAELTEIAIDLVRLVIFHVECPKLDKFTHFGGKLACDTFTHKTPSETSKIEARELTGVLRVIRRALPQVEQFKDLCYDIRVKAMHAHLSDCRKNISEMVSNFDEANELSGLEVFGIIEEVQTHAGTCIVDKIDNVLKQRLLMCSDILTIKSKIEEDLFARVQASEQFKKELMHLFETIVDTVASRKIKDVSVNSSLSLGTTVEQRILISLANIEKLKTMTPNFLEYFKKQKFKDTDSISKQIREKCKTTIQHLISEYIETATGPLVTAIEPRMYSTGYNWEEEHFMGPDFSVTDVSPRGYVHKVLIDLLKICSESSFYCPIISKSIIDDCICKILEEMLRMLRCMPKNLPLSSTVQAYYDVIALQACFNRFRGSTKVDRLFTDIFSVIKKHSSVQSEATGQLRKEVEDVMKDIWVENQELVYESFANY